jgi:hypothetical protein
MLPRIEYRPEIVSTMTGKLSVQQRYQLAGMFNHSLTRRDELMKELTALDAKIETLYAILENHKSL